MNRETARYEQLISDRLAEIKQEKLEMLGRGVELQEYKQWTGYIRCLHDIASIMEYAHKKVDQD